LLSAEEGVKQILAEKKNIIGKVDWNGNNRSKT
jgi:hypothetical protein